MERLTLNAVELEFEVRGDGDPVVLIHAGLVADWFVPLLSEPLLAERYRLISYHRTGYAASPRMTDSVSLAQQAAHCRALMRHLGIERAHVVGHSSGGNIALQLALDAPDAPHTLALLEPALLAVPSGPRVAATVVAPAMQRYAAGDKDGAVDQFLRGVAGPRYREVMAHALPSGALDRAVRDADTFFGQELPALQQWAFTREDAGRVTQPVLAVLGAESHTVSPVFRERHELLLAWLPHAETFVLPGATHLLHLQNPRGMAEGLAASFARHPLPTDEGSKTKDQR